MDRKVYSNAVSPPGVMPLSVSQRSGDGGRNSGVGRGSGSSGYGISATDLENASMTNEHLESVMASTLQQQQQQYHRQQQQTGQQKTSSLNGTQQRHSQELSGWPPLT